MRFSDGRSAFVSLRGLQRSRRRIGGLASRQLPEDPQTALAAVSPSSPVVDEIGFFRSIFGVEST
jgi:hypothetical protein